ncbi:MAG: ASKHA domain-containing protein [Desulfobacterales bacterium]|jgi:uncharacterized 2Fe-2S/4Fe-4S cluster protein (DUF4445 family)|nr:ASKHA domain-containing protein [Desulfobacterales bacterium]
MVHFPETGRQETAREGETLLDLARRIYLPISSVCGGQGRCGKCRIIVEQAEPGLPPPTEKEGRLLGDLIHKGYRLACETPASGASEVRFPLASRHHGHVILTAPAALSAALKPRPNLEAYEVIVPEPVLAPPVADRERLLQALGNVLALKSRRLQADPSVLRRLPHVLRSANHHVTVVIRNRREIVDARPGGRQRLYGIAFDVGTTTVVGYLLDLQSGETLAVRSALNPQAAYGADVISRITHSMKQAAGLVQLQAAVVDCLNRITAVASSDAGIAPDDIVEACAVGNTAMHHFLFGLDPRYLAAAPYPAALQRGQEFRARDFGLNICPAGYIYLPPLKAGFVGSDAIACVVATRMHHSRLPTLLVDLGTNGEIVYGNREKMACCSTAAGPAFEGGHIRWGMRAANGAIERLRLSPGSLEVEAVTIGGQRPVGICGSGLISAAAELIRYGVLLQTGSFNPKLQHPRLRRGRDGWEFVLAWEPETDVGEDVVMTQKDVSELIMAKAAIHAGASLLIEQLGIGSPARILMAGAGGNYIAPQDAAAIGLLPGCGQERLQGVGNAAGYGACMMLLNSSMRGTAERISRRIDYLELAAEKRFQELFVSGMFFPSASDYGNEF